MGKNNEILFAKRSFVAEVDGRRVVVRRGRTRVRSDDAVVKGRERLFGPADDEVVETARRAPGEKRATRRKTAAKKTAARKPAAGSDGQ